MSTEHDLCVDGGSTPDLVKPNLDFFTYIYGQNVLVDQVFGLILGLCHMYSHKVLEYFNKYKITYE